MLLIATRRSADVHLDGRRKKQASLARFALAGNIAPRIDVRSWTFVAK